MAARVWSTDQGQGHGRAADALAGAPANRVVFDGSFFAQICTSYTTRAQVERDLRNGSSGFTVAKTGRQRCAGLGCKRGSSATQAALARLGPGRGAELLQGAQWAANAYRPRCKKLPGCPGLRHRFTGRAF